MFMKTFILCIMLSFPALAIIGGVPLDAPKDGIIFFAMNSSGCTASKVSSNMLITAAHCVMGEKFDKILFQTQSQEWHSLTVKQVSIHPSYTELAEGSDEEEDYLISLFAFDVAFIEIIPNDLFKTLPSLEIDLGEISVNDEVSFIGFGCQQTINDTNNFVPTKKISNTRIASQNLLDQKHGVDALDELLKDLSNDLDFVQLITYGKRAKEDHASLCLGDSGGPLLRNNKLIGINSNYTFTDTSEDGSASGISFLNLHTRLNLIKDWILSHTER